MSMQPLIGRIEQTLTDLEQVVQRVALLRDKAQQSGDDGYWDGVGLNLHSFYTGVERIFEDIARTLEQTVPDGLNWHQDLLLQMSAEMTAIRPPVITLATRHCLDEYRGFRHVVRNVYAFHLRPSRLAELAQELPACFQAVSQDLQRFVPFLQQIS